VIEASRYNGGPALVAGPASRRPVSVPRGRANTFDLISAVKTNPELDVIEQNLKTLRIEYEKYFNGANDLPPGALQAQLERMIRLTRTRLRTSIDRFRFSSLEAQFNSYNEMFNRRVRALEEGRTLRPRTAPAPSGAPDISEGVRVSGSIGEADADALYKALYGGGSAKVGPEAFREYLNRQTAKIQERTGCSEVQFRLTEEDGKPKLKAKPLRG